MSQVRGSWCCYWVTFKHASPAGANGQVTYGGLSGGPFSIHPQTGLIVTTHPLDREEQEQHVLMGMAVLVHGRKQQAPGGRGGGHGAGRCTFSAFGTEQHCKEGRTWEVMEVCGTRGVVG